MPERLVSSLISYPPSLDGLAFTPESIVSVLAALGEKRSERESQMLARFLSASVLPSLKDEASKLFLRVEVKHGIFLGVFSGIEIIQNLDGPSALILAQHSVCPVSIRNLMSQAAHTTAGVILNPFSELAVEFPWRKLAIELAEFDRGTRWISPAAPEQFRFEPQIWDPDLLSAVQEWIDKKQGVAQIVLGCSSEQGTRVTVKVFLDCVKSVFEDCAAEVYGILELHKNTLPDGCFLSIVHCDDPLRLEKMERAGARLISRLR